LRAIQSQVQQVNRDIWSAGRRFRPTLHRTRQENIRCERAKLGSLSGTPHNLIGNMLMLGPLLHPICTINRVFPRPWKLARRKNHRCAMTFAPLELAWITDRSVPNRATVKFLRRFSVPVPRIKASSLLR
jgi:hypothetical protein